MFALWSWDGRPAEPPTVPSGAQATLPLAAPTPTGDAIAVTDVECLLFDVDTFATLAVPAAATSVHAWQSQLRSVPPSFDEFANGADELRVAAGTLPPAAHAVPDASGTSIIAAARALQVLHATRGVAAAVTATGSTGETPATAGTLTADLRPYQVRGIGWLTETIAEYGGAVLADEMGLGKTIQAIGCLSLRSELGPQLVVCPTSLVGNWAREISRFAPHLKVSTWRSGELAPEPGEIVVAGYPALRLHGRHLFEHEWATAILDEAQALKNPRTQVAKAAKTLRAAALVALTGTPVENRLEELWALLNLVSPSLFGHRTQFRRRFVRPIEAGSTAAAARLRDAVEPVLLTRKKSQVAASLPPKIHLDLRCDLTVEQEHAYDRVLGEAIEAGFGAGVMRRSRVLAALTALKQVCNHPGLLTEELDTLAERSGKLELCTDILTTNLETGSPTLVFTQYRRTGELLVRHLSEQLDVRAPFLHGALDLRERERIVTDFQSENGPPVMILSLRAAGTGLTLTRAADVIHYDRWWNPAVEAQASDRVHRIGQTRTVTVTTLTSTTTVEEHIAGMHERKSALTDLGADTGIAALADMDDEQLIEILRRKRGN